ncbi:hypothetical protein SteCoe_27098 [Stentor coeruleus]|uniref:RING-type domain-containing protein n=1 Tax=Stentor coeruleus TaxID=5963 RepID=A0A1R2BBC3_9CILI|nr:hypothetical protein SteCoe_27098 [Stentor coeruleus]
MGFCDDSCLLCDNPGLIAVNHASYHRACKYHASELLKASPTITCLKCQSKVFIVSEIITENSKIPQEKIYPIQKNVEIQQKNLSSSLSVNLKNPKIEYSDRAICPNCGRYYSDLKSYCDHIVCSMCKNDCKKCKEKGEKGIKAKIFNVAKSTGGMIAKSVSGILGNIFFKQDCMENEDMICPNCETKGNTIFECNCSNKICTECHTNCKLCQFNPNRCPNCNSLCIPKYEFECGDQCCYKCINNGCNKHMDPLKRSNILFGHQKNDIQVNKKDGCIYCSKDCNNQYKDCVHKVCLNCLRSNPVCLKVEYRQCVICNDEHPENELIVHEIGKICKKCFEIHCTGDMKIKCSNCKEVVERLYKMKCGHKGCLKCSMINERCHKCSIDYSNQTIWV